MQELFLNLQTAKKNKGTYNTKKFMNKIRKANQIFDNDYHHDSHEFLSWLLNDINDDLITDWKESQLDQKKAAKAVVNTFITDLFGGESESVTTCLVCQKTSSMKESFIDL